MMEARSSGKTYTITVTSGKGGVGKTLTSVNLAAAARRGGMSVLILDGDLGLANVDVVLGVSARYSIADVLAGNASLDEVIVQGPMGISVLPSGSGIASLAALSSLQKDLLSEQIQALVGRYDLILIDAGAGIGDNVVTFAKAADRVLVVTTPEPHATCDAYAVIKVLHEDQGIKTFDLLVNQVRSEGEGLKVYERISEVAKRFLSARVHYVGSVPLDPQVPRAVMARKAASEHSTYTIAGQGWTNVARRMFFDAGALKATDGDGAFWRQVLWSDVGKTRALAGI